jgi:hypothetical protein
MNCYETDPMRCNVRDVLRNGCTQWVPRALVYLSLQILDSLLVDHPDQVCLHSTVAFLSSSVF